MNHIEKLTEYFTRFPGIGPRQAQRFVYFLLGQSNGYTQELAEAIRALQHEVAQCESCLRFFTQGSGSARQCALCADTERDAGMLMIVAKDVDIESVERAGVYSGYYFVLGGVMPVAGEQPERYIRSTDLTREIARRANANGVREVILALPAHPEGDETARYVQELLAPLAEQFGFSVSMLGRGLSTGLELEYSDGETLRNALEGRHRSE